MVSYQLTKKQLFRCSDWDTGWTAEGSWFGSRQGLEILMPFKDPGRLRPALLRIQHGIKVKLTLERALKAKRGSRSIGLLFL